MGLPVLGRGGGRQSPACSGVPPPRCGKSWRKCRAPGSLQCYVYTVLREWDFLYCKAPLFFLKLWGTTHGVMKCVSVHKLRCCFSSSSHLVFLRQGLPVSWNSPRRRDWPKSSRGLPVAASWRQTASAHYHTLKTNTQTHPGSRDWTESSCLALYRAASLAKVGCSVIFVFLGMLSSLWLGEETL